MDVRRGDIFYIRKGNGDCTGHEMTSDRPGIIVSNNKGNCFSENVEIVYLTSQEKTPLPTHVPVRCKVPSTALCEGVYTVAKERLGEYVRTATEDEMAEVDKALAISLDLKYSDIQDNFSTSQSDSLAMSSKDADTNLSMELVKAQTERDLYKNMFESLLGKVVSA